MGGLHGQTQGCCSVLERTLIYCRFLALSPLLHSSLTHSKGAIFMSIVFRSGDECEDKIREEVEMEQDIITSILSLKVD
jgi:hypothetical protein